MNKNQQSLNLGQHKGARDPGRNRGERRFPEEGKEEKNIHHYRGTFASPHQGLFRRSSLILITILGRNFSTKFHVRELSRSSGYDVSMVSKNLKQLGEADLVTREEVGNLVLYQANMKSVLLRQFKICLTLLDLTDLIRDLDTFTTNIILYGSCATGEDTEESDIDLFIETLDKKDVRRITGTAQQKIERTLAPVIQTPDETYQLRSGNATLFNNIQRGIVLKG